MFVPLLLGDQRQHGGAVEHRLWQHHPQEEAHLHRTHADGLGGEQRLVVLRAEQRMRRVQPRCSRYLVQGTA
jgi:hypothetical protein